MIDRKLIMWAVKRSILDTFEQFGDWDAVQHGDQVALMRSPAISAMVKTRIESVVDKRLSQAKVTRELEKLVKEGVLLKNSQPGCWNGYWPVGYADELASADMNCAKS